MDPWERIEQLMDNCKDLAWRMNQGERDIKQVIYHFERLIENLDEVEEICASFPSDRPRVTATVHEIRNTINLFRGQMDKLCSLL